MSNIVLSQSEAAERVKSLYDGEYELISEFSRNFKPITIKHVCGHSYDTIAKYFFEGSNKCPICYPPTRAKRGATMNEEMFKERFKEELKDEYTYLGGFTKYKDHVNIRHNTCGHEYQVSPHMLLGSKKRRCPNCANKKRGLHVTEGAKENPGINPIVTKSLSAITLEKVLTELGFDFMLEYKTKNLINELGVLLSIDYFIPELKLFIECDGDQHFKFIETSIFNKRKIERMATNDLIKNRYVLEKKDYTLLRIPDKVDENDIRQLFNCESEEEQMNLIEKLGCMIVTNGSEYRFGQYINQYSKFTEDSNGDLKLL